MEIYFLIVHLLIINKNKSLLCSICDLKCLSICNYQYPSLAQLVERETVEFVAISRSLVRFRLLGFFYILQPREIEIFEIFKIFEILFKFQKFKISNFPNIVQKSI